jgi:hypothetical protein
MEFEFFVNEQRNQSLTQNIFSKLIYRSTGEYKKLMNPAETSIHTNITVLADSASLDSKSVSLQCST